MIGPGRRHVLRLGGVAAAAALPAPAIAQAAWPSKPIRIVCSYPPGGLTDIFARAYGEYISQRTGQPAVVENKAGAAGGVAGPDGEGPPPASHPPAVGNTPPLRHEEHPLDKQPHHTRHTRLAL